MGRVYLIQEAKLIGINRFKVGATAKDDDSRQKKYGRTRRELMIVRTEIPFLIEKEIKKKFNETFKLIAGSETFEGDENKMIEEFDKICKKYNGLEYIDSIKEEPKQAKNPNIKLYAFQNINYQLTYYDRSDVLRNWGKDHSHDKNYSEDKMIQLAIQNKNFIITKGGKNALWYLKGDDENFNKILEFKNKLENDGKKDDGIYSILIEKF